MSAVDTVRWPEVHPPSSINDWSGWPEDVVAKLRYWNRNGREMRLTFGGAGRVFKCTTCQEFHQSHRYGAAVFNGRPYCDPCLIDLARQAVAS